MTPQERIEFIADLTAALQKTTPEASISPEQLQWVNLAIQKEAQSIKLRQAVIEKTLAALIWAGIAGVGYVIMGWAQQHGFKP